MRQSQDERYFSHRLNWSRKVVWHWNRVRLRYPFCTIKSDTKLLPHSHVDFKLRLSGFRDKEIEMNGKGSFYKEILNQAQSKHGPLTVCSKWIASTIVSFKTAINCALVHFIFRRFFFWVNIDECSSIDYVRLYKQILIPKFFSKYWF